MRYNLTKELVSRTNNLSFYKYIGVLPNPDKVLSHGGKNYQNLRNLKNDPHLWACIQSRKSGVISNKYRLVQGNARQDIFDFVTECLSNIDVNKLIKQILDAVLFGFQPIEIIWKEKLFNGNMLFAIDRLEARPQEYFVFDGNSKLKYISIADPNGKKMPKYKCLLVQHESDYDNPYGQSLLSKCYWSCTFKNSAIRFWVNFIERFGNPVVIATSENLLSDTEQQQLLDSLAEMQDNNTIVASGNISVQIHDSAKQGNVLLYKELIDICNAEISKVILSQTLTTQIEQGSFAASKTHYEIRKEVIESDMVLVKHSMDILIGYICDLNFGNVELPFFEYEVE